MVKKTNDNMIEIAGHDIIVRKSQRRKTMAIKVNNEGIFLHIPDILPMEIARAFVEKKTAWIEQKLNFTNPQLAANQYSAGDQLFFMGESHRIVLQDDDLKQPVIDRQQEQLVLSGALAELTMEDRQNAFKKWYQQQATAYLIDRSLLLSARYDLKANSFQVKTYKARWGSCSQDGHIRYNWKIIQASKGIIDYLIIHELCHLKEHNHSANFWQLVAKLCPDYKQHRQWLKTYGHLINL